MAPVLEIKGLQKKFSGFTLKDINLSLDQGYIMGFIGPNGAGKSTTMKLILNLLKKDRGEIKIFGRDHLKNEIEIKNRIGFVLDENYFYEELTVREMKRILSPFYRNWDEKVFSQYLKDFDLPPHQKIKSLSKGTKMKFSLAVALSHQADFFLMDEPTSGLDPVIRNELLEILSWIRQDEKKAVFFSTHITSDLEKIADYVTLIDQGEIVLSTGKDDLLEKYGLVRGGKELLTGDVRTHFIGIKENQFGFQGLVQDKQRVRQLLGDRVLIEKPTLEDVMLYYTRRGAHA
ncbi:ABC transporter ATP-binding protein [Candidatus Formimonas warabiya]|uniref:Sodium ABC transporter ATP-binding protein n=1 Tax=Formimonas warabiya TaxID=1761012 RepID=A0A3G1KSQ3_FORW1|nr:ABC transporter ATP-binding protein [Candidatus Formimonas warabiya]ATW25195.1 sodium ABC transporter ATP-binding protein [Candidatus Formimonas warabiya]